MRKNFLAATAATLSLCGLLAGPAFAADAMSGAPDCSKASSMMQGDMMSGDHTMSSDHAMGDHAMAQDANQSVDASYLKSMKTMLDHESTMSKMELACGKDAAVKAQAKKSLDEMQLSQDQFRKLLQSITL